MGVDLIDSKLLLTTIIRWRRVLWCCSIVRLVVIDIPTNQDTVSPCYVNKVPGWWCWWRHNWLQWCLWLWWLLGLWEDNCGKERNIQFKSLSYYFLKIKCLNIKTVKYFCKYNIFKSHWISLIQLIKENLYNIILGGTYTDNLRVKVALKQTIY